MSSTGSGGTGSSKWEVVGIIAQVAAVLVAAAAAVAAYKAADEADRTAKRIQEIEEERHDDERLEDIVKAQITTYFSSSCEDRAEMVAPTLDRFYDLSEESTEEVTRADVREACEDAKSDDLEFILLEITEVIGTPDSERAHAVVKLGSYNTPAGHDLVDTASLEIVVRLDRGWEDDKDPTFPITSMAETIEAA